MTEEQKINIVERFIDGECLDKISKDYYLSKQRIHQIIKRFVPKSLLQERKQQVADKKAEMKYGTKEAAPWIKKVNEILKERRKEVKAGLRWSVPFTECIQCGTTSSKHHTRGRCKRCVSAYLYATDPKRRESLKKATNAWRKKNPEKARAICKRASLKYWQTHSKSHVTKRNIKTIS